MALFLLVMTTPAPYQPKMPLSQVYLYFSDKKQQLPTAKAHWLKPITETDLVRTRVLCVEIVHQIDYVCCR